MELGIFILTILLFSMIIHEIAHGSVANWLGDPTAKNAGRLTLNPLKHLDPFGSIILPLVLFFSYSISGIQGPIVGWAVPVPVNPYNLRDKKWGILKVSVAGPAINFLVAIFFGLLIRFAPLPVSFLLLFNIIAVYNFLWGLFNLVPIPPLDGAWILFSFLPAKWESIKVFLTRYSLLILLFFIFFGLDFLAIGARALYFFISGKLSFL